MLRKMGGLGRSPYRAQAMPGTDKALAQHVLGFEPDLVFTHHGRAASMGNFISHLHRNGKRVACYLCDEPYETGETARYSPKFDVVFTMDPCTVEAHRKSREKRANVYYLPPGVDTQRFAHRAYFDDEDALIRSKSAFFLGNASLIPREPWLRPIDKLVDGADIRYFDPVGKHTKGKWVPLKDHAALYSDCVVGLNVHRSPAISRECFIDRVQKRGDHINVPAGLKLCEQMPAEPGTGFWNDGNLPAAHANPRFMEMASCGTCVVSDSHRSELARMFPMAPQAESPEHFYELVDYYIKHPREAEEIGRACSTLILRRHTYTHRAAEVLIHSGFKDAFKDDLLTSLGEPQDWMTPQDCGPQGITSFSERTGPSERWSPQHGLSLTRKSGSPKDSTSLDVETPWP